MSIQIVLVDRDDNILGYKEKYEAHKHPVPLHRAVSVFVYDKHGKKMLLQKRSSEKPTWPGYWSNATCSHPLPDESYKDAAERKLFEEMGVKIPLQEVFKIVYKAKYDKTWGEHELDTFYVGEYEGNIVPDPREVAEWKWMDISDLKGDISTNSDIYTPWFKLGFGRLH